jgi:hypothetical protein
MKFRKKPVVIEAMQFKFGMDSEAVNQFIGDSSQEFSFTTGDGESLIGIEIETLEGTMAVSPDDWIIKGIKGEFYPCKPDIFAASYEAAE